MDNLRGHFPETGGDAGSYGYDAHEDEIGHEAPPSPVGQDERRMQVRAYNFWAGLLQDRRFPSIEDLDPDNLPDFGPQSVLLDFTGGIENPAVQYLGSKLAEECVGAGTIRTLSDVPSRSLLSRITDHYMQILANQAPIGFEAEFVNQREHTVLYRGILLPFSSDDDTIDFIYGVINWKELADPQTSDDLLLEIDQALDAGLDTAPESTLKSEDIVDWADGPANLAPLEQSDEEVADSDVDWPEVSFGHDSARPHTKQMALPPIDFDAPFGHVPLRAESDDWSDNPAHADATNSDGGEMADDVTPAATTAAIVDDSEMCLADWLDSARQLAQAAKGSEDRSRQALYAAIGRAYDFSLAAAEAPEEFDEIVTDAGLTAQDRAPMTPVVKLVFGADYDKTRLTEYASALSHGHRIGVKPGALAAFLISAPGGLKGVVNAERRLKREEQGRPVEPRETPREALARKLRKLDHAPLDSVSNEGSEFTVLVARRLPTGQVVLLGEIADDIALLERAARKLVS